MPKHKKYSVKLSEQDREILESFVSDGRKSAREINRARILLLADKNRKDREIAEVLGVCRRTVYCTEKRFGEGGHESVLDFLKEKSRTGRPAEIDSRTEADITALACSSPPEGHAERTLRLIADRLVKPEMAESISP
jgi:putative transposase